MNPAIFSVAPVAVSWSEQEIAGSDDTLNAVVYNGTKWVAGGVDTSGLFPCIASASDPASTWTEGSVSNILGTTIRSFSTNGSRIVVGSTGLSYSDDNGTTWSVGLATGTAIYGIAWNGSKFVAVGQTRHSYTSSDGITWTTHSDVLIGTARALGYGNGLFVAVADNGYIATSTDGITWTDRSVGGTVLLLGVAYKNGTWCAVGYDASGGSPFLSTILLSSDAITWNAQTTPTGMNLSQCITTKGQWFVVGGSAKVWKSISGQTGTWTQSGTGITGTPDINGIISGNNKIVAVGRSPSFSKPVVWVS